MEGNRGTSIFRRRQSEPSCWTASGSTGMLSNHGRAGWWPMGALFGRPAACSQSYASHDLIEVCASCVLRQAGMCWSEETQETRMRHFGAS